MADHRFAPAVASHDGELRGTSSKVSSEVFKSAQGQGGKRRFGPVLLGNTGTRLAQCKDAKPWNSSKPIARADKDTKSKGMEARSGTDSSSKSWRSLSPMKVPLPSSFRVPSSESWRSLSPMDVPLPSSFDQDFFDGLDTVDHLEARWPEPAWGGMVWVRSCQSTVPIPMVQAAFPSASESYADMGDWCAGPARGQIVERLPEALCTGNQKQQQWQRHERRQPCQAGSRKKQTLTCKFVFTGFDLNRDAAFELVPRLIGRGGCNTRMISQACHGKVHLRGRGSRPNGPQATGDMDEPLHLTFSSPDPENFQEGLKLVDSILAETRQHFVRYCHKQGIHPTPQLYTRVC